MSSKFTRYPAGVAYQVLELVERCIRRTGSAVG